MRVRKFRLALFLSLTGGYLIYILFMWLSVDRHWKLHTQSEIEVENVLREIDLQLRPGEGCVLEIPVHHFDDESFFHRNHQAGTLYLLFKEGLPPGSPVQPDQIVWSGHKILKLLAVDPDDPINLRATLVHEDADKPVVKVSGNLSLKHWYPVDHLSEFSEEESDPFTFDELYGVKIVWRGKSKSLTFDDREQKLDH
ncbi:hypothetical protein SAMN02745181_0304 [Rubritalea squalenifaciens DSM 18772]|uniref:Uncharacterized protein n=1 Tax=Rubritalea squalenifaciens DSM 18772 TaxID=1123071 RepID=A0A1M6BTD6_9BACT|nr:hypothetical protein [Rubritalea squalenifaciens]SHI51990.1 hypothetical protein SAMN02745181_0304 [Rubritalea squalenifaciens DSM 18772]